MIPLDGNNSMKRTFQLGEHRSINAQPFTNSDYLLPPKYVDQFEDEVGMARAPGVLVGDNKENGEVEGDSSEATLRAQCTTNWKAASAEEEDVGGICGDGVLPECVLSLTHMLILGHDKEWRIVCHSCLYISLLLIYIYYRAKYPLAHIAKALDIMEDNFLFGSDIGCSLKKTIVSSSLGPKLKAKNCKCCINTFHGHTHNWVCQRENQPNVIKGLGLEDLETLKRIFSASNSVATITRYLTAYCCRVFIDLFLQQWDEEKYANLGNFFYNNYKQALDIIKDDLPTLKKAL